MYASISAALDKVEEFYNMLKKDILNQEFIVIIDFNIKVKLQIQDDYLKHILRK